MSLAHVDPVRFNRACAMLALLFLLATIVGKLLWRTSDQDFPQYYMGGVIARYGLWDQLYPVPKAGSTRNPGFFDDSELKPRYAQLAEQRGVGQMQVRYMQPPPFALLLAPLSFLTYRQAYVLWTIGLLLCTWGVSVQAGWILNQCRGRVSKLAGILTILVAISPTAHRWIRVQNISPLLGLLIGAAVLTLLSRRPLRGALAMWLGGLAKYATGALVPLYVVMRQWRALLWTAGISAASVLVCVAIMSWAPFREYFQVIAPTLKNTNTLTENQAIQALVARLVHGPRESQDLEALQRKLAGRSPVPPTAMRVILVVQGLSLLLILALIFSRWRGGTRAWTEHPPLVFAAASALLCWMLIFSPIFWEHYHAYLAPLWGWVAYEATRSRIRLIAALMIGVMSYVPTSLVLTQLGLRQLPEPISSHLLMATVLMLLLAIDRLARGVDDD